MEDFLQSWKNYFDIGANTNPNHIHDAIVEDRVVSRIREAFTDGEKQSLKDVVQELFDELLSTHGKQIPVQM